MISIRGSIILVSFFTGYFFVMAFYSGFFANTVVAQVLFSVVSLAYMVVHIFLNLMYVL